MQMSHSRLECFEHCKRKYRLQYVDQLGTIPDDSADNALFLGTALHTGIETRSVEQAIEQYYSNYPIIADEHITEAMKLEVMIPKAQSLAPEGMYEVKIDDEDFIGFIDLLVPVSDDGGIKVFDLYDFKYSNNKKNYLDSDQLHLYKYFFEKHHPDSVIRNMYFLMVPKSKLKRIKDEDIKCYRHRILIDCNMLTPELVEIAYNPNKVIQFLTSGKHLIEYEGDYPMHTGFMCQYCQYNDYCQKGWDYMILPKNERRNINAVTKKVVWVYGAPFSGKTTFANAFPDPLMLNTDGNYKFVDAPVLPIKDDVHKEGRMTIRKSAWEVFKDAVAELETKDNTFKTIVVDLVEDVYEFCRRYVCDQKGWTHESDDSFRAWDMVRTEFLTIIKKLMALDYENIVLISHLDATKDLTKKGGDKLSTIKPNITDKIANKLAGMVDIVARAVAEDGRYTLNFKSNEVIFGGGRLKFRQNEIPLDYEHFCELYDEANKNFASGVSSKDTMKNEEVHQTAITPAEEQKVTNSTPDSVQTDSVASDAPVRSRRRRTAEEVPAEVKEYLAEDAKQTQEIAEAIDSAENGAVSAEATTGTDETPVVRRRRRRTEE